jgi:ribonuclease VapC
VIFADASALVSIIAQEPDGEALVAILQGDPDRRCSAISVWETIAALCNSYKFSVPDAWVRVTQLSQRMHFQYVLIGEREADIAAIAYEKFGKGRHPAALNMGDCFAYACARANGAKLLFKGDDFAKTDIATASAAAAQATFR